MDPLPEILSLVKISRCWSGGFDWGGKWSIGCGRHQGIKVYAVVSGECWPSVEGDENQRPGCYGL